MKRNKIFSIVGTRPEVIKMAPVIRALGEDGRFESLIVTTAQHRQMLDQVLSVFGIEPDVDLGLMQHDQSLAGFASRSLLALSDLFDREKPDFVLVQGDTTTVMTAALAAFYNGVKVGHIEAGLRSLDRLNPFPEEMNRHMAGCLANLHFAPTERARQNLLREGVREEDVFVTGNTIVDALLSIPLEGPFDDPGLATADLGSKRIVLVTAHRRENHGRPLKSICRALKELVAKFDDITVIYPVHLNPNVSSPVREELGGVRDIKLIDPVSYSDLLKLMNRSYLILTDSGGMQEEAPSFHKPVLVLRELTERPEVIQAGAGRIVGTISERIVEAVSLLLNDNVEYKKMSEVRNPFGDGHAAERIVELIAQHLESELKSGTVAEKQVPKI
jgi:UDP-N-acetylglucosamine 2-epimerase (non-hydrolysing)